MPCNDMTPRSFSGHWRDYHRGHGCELDPTPTALSPTKVAEIVDFARRRQGESLPLAWAPCTLDGAITVIAELANAPTTFETFCISDTTDDDERVMRGIPSLDAATAIAIDFHREDPSPTLLGDTIPGARVVVSPRPDGWRSNVVRALRFDNHRLGYWGAIQTEVRCSCCRRVIGG